MISSLFLVYELLQDCAVCPNAGVLVLDVCPNADTVVLDVCPNAGAVCPNNGVVVLDDCPNADTVVLDVCPNAGAVVLPNADAVVLDDCPNAVVLEACPKAGKLLCLPFRRFLEDEPVPLLSAELDNSTKFTTTKLLLLLTKIISSWLTKSIRKTER